MLNNIVTSKNMAYCALKDGYSLGFFMQSYVITLLRFSEDASDFVSQKQLPCYDWLPLLNGA